MKKMLFISNISNQITNFSIPSIEAAHLLGYEFHMAANYSGFTGDASKYNVILHHIDLVRNPFSFKNIKAFKQMLALLKRERFDVIHCNTPIGGILGRLCGKIAKVPKVIYTAHGFHFYKGAPFINCTVYKWAEMWMAHYTNVILTINKEDYEAAQKFKLRKGGKVYYIPGVGVGTKNYQPKGINKQKYRKKLGIPLSATVVVSVGDLNKNKNHEVVIKALAKLNDPLIYYVLVHYRE